MKHLVRSIEGSLSPAPVLATVFAAFYMAVGPGNFFSTDEVTAQESAQAVIERANLEIPAVVGAVRGLGGGYYANKWPGLLVVALPSVAVGNLMDGTFGSMTGGTAAGPPIGTPEHPLRWGGRLTIFTALMTNALLGGFSVAVLFLIGTRLGASSRASVLMAIAAGTATLCVTESTHFFRHPLETLGLLLGFWFLVRPDPAKLLRPALLGSAGLGIAVLAGPNLAPAAAVLWLFGAFKGWRAADGNISRRLLSRTAALATVPPLLCVALYLHFNEIRFGNPISISGAGSEGSFVFLVPEAIRALVAYLFSPSLSVFLFAPPILLALAGLPESLRRWPVETKAILYAVLASVPPILMFSHWHGHTSYGPRYMLAPILLLMPLSLPVFERLERPSLGRWRVSAALVLSVGVLVQASGLTVYVTVNEWRRSAMGYDSGRTADWVFVPSLCPPFVHMNEMLAGRNLSPWALRAMKQPGTPLVFFALLVALVAAGVRWLWRFYGRADHTKEGTWLPERLVLGLSVLIGVGFLLTGSVRDPLPTRALGYMNDGMAAHREGRTVMAQELYALVLGLQPQNKYALYNLALLHETAGQADRAAALFQRVVALDPGFALASAALARLGRIASAVQPAPPAPQNAGQCHSRAQAFWDAGNKNAALATWEECGQKFPDQSVFVRNVARCRYDLGDFDGAVRDYQRLTALLPNDSAAKTDLAWALLRAGRLSEARRTSQAVLERDPGNIAARAVLGQVAEVSEGKK